MRKPVQGHACQIVKPGPRIEQDDIMTRFQLRQHRRKRETHRVILPRFCRREVEARELLDVRFVHAASRVNGDVLAGVALELGHHPEQRANARRFEIEIENRDLLLCRLAREPYGVRSDQRRPTHTPLERMKRDDRRGPRIVQRPRWAGRARRQPGLLADRALDPRPSLRRADRHIRPAKHVAIRSRPSARPHSGRLLEQVLRQTLRFP